MPEPSGNSDDTVPEEGSDGEDHPEDIDWDNYPVGADSRVKETVAEGISQSAQSGAMGDVLSQYNPDQFNELVGRLADEYRESSVRNYKFKLRTLLLSVVLVIGLFSGLMYYSLQTSNNGGALIFFAGTLAGYFMRLATDLY